MFAFYLVRRTNGVLRHLCGFVVCCVLLSVLPGALFASPADSGVIKLSLKDVKVTVPTNAKLNLFVNGGELATISKAEVAAAANEVTFHCRLQNNAYYGIGEIVIEKLGSFPLVIHGNQSLQLDISAAQLRSYAPPPVNPELESLGMFLKIYHGFEAMYAHHYNILVSPWGRFSSDTAAYADFLKEYGAFRKQLNDFFDYAAQYYPHTYVADHLSGLFASPVENDLQTLRDTYFTRWRFSDSNILNNPLMDRQLSIYLFISSFPSIADADKTTDALYATLKAGKVAKTVADHINQYWIVCLFKNNADGSGDKHIAHFYNKWLSSDMESCNEEAAAGEVFEKAFYKRLANIGNVQDGMKLPDIKGLTADSKPVSLQARLGEKPYTLVFIWSSTCSHCEEYAPLLQQFAGKHSDKLNVLAYSIDKDQTKNGWLQLVKKRSALSNWTDIAEPGDMSSAGISRICYMGTPSIFLLDNRGTILSRSTDISLLSEKMKL